MIGQPSESHVPWGGGGEQGEEREEGGGEGGGKRGRRGEEGEERREGGKANDDQVSDYARSGVNKVLKGWSSLCTQKERTAQSQAREVTQKKPS